MDDDHTHDNIFLDYTCVYVKRYSDFIRRKLAACELVLCLTIHVVCNMPTLALAAPGVEKHRAFGLVLPSRISTMATLWESMYFC